MRIRAALGIVAMAALSGCGRLLTAADTSNDPDSGSAGDAATDVGSSNDSGADAGSDAGDKCIDFCRQVLALCVGQYTSDTECLSNCHSWPLGDRSSATGNTFWCRQLFLAAAQDDTGVEAADDCRSAGLDGGVKCN
jgi:hypothetical protein